MKKITSILIGLLLGIGLFAQHGVFDAKYAKGIEVPVLDETPIPNPSQRAVMLSEGFDDITTLSGNGWAMINNSNPLGITNWFQGVSGVFPAYDGAADAYIVANFNNTTGTNTISNWLVMPEQTINNGDEITFFTRSAGGGWYDRLQVRLSTSVPVPM